MNCPNCMKEVPVKVKVCGFCGTKLEKMQINICPDCGRELPAKAKVCGYCGAKLLQPAAEITQEPAPAKKVGKTKEKAAKPVKKVDQPKVKREIKKISIPKWIYGVVGGVIVVALILLFVLPLFSSNGGGEGSSILLPFSGKWVGDIKGVYSDFSASVELDFDRRCSIGQVCGSYNLINAECNGDLELISVTNNVYTFLEHPEVNEFLEGFGQQSMRLVGDTLRWSFEQTLPSGEVHKNIGVFDRN